MLHFLEMFPFKPFQKAFKKVHQKLVFYHFKHNVSKTQPYDETTIFTASKHALRRLKNLNKSSLFDCLLHTPDCTYMKDHREQKIILCTPDSKQLFVACLKKTRKRVKVDECWGTASLWNISMEGWKMVRTAAKRQSNCWSSIMIKGRFHSDLSWFCPLLLTSLSSASPSCHLAACYMQCRHYTKNLCEEKLKWNWNCCFQREMNLAQKMIFRFLFFTLRQWHKNNSFLSAASTLHEQYTYNIIIIIISWWCRYGVKWRAGKETRGGRASIIAVSSKMEIENNYHPNSAEFSVLRRRGDDLFNEGIFYFVRNKCDGVGITRNGGIMC